MHGGDRSLNQMDGGDGSDVLYAGNGGNAVNFMSGGVGDDADDVAFGGDGADIYRWAVSGDGSDTFHGGDASGNIAGREGQDRLVLDLDSLGGSGFQEAVESGLISLSLIDADDNPVIITDDMWSQDQWGNEFLSLPEGCDGVITGQNGDTLTFTNVDVISA